MVPTSQSPEKLLGVQILGSDLPLTEQETSGLGPSSLSSDKPSRDSETGPRSTGCGELQA